jgi:hypothetical protein
MAKISFSLDNIRQETPAPVRAAYRALMFLAAFWVMVLEPRFPGITEHVKYIIDSALVCTTNGVYYICQYFGWQVPKPSDPVMQNTNTAAADPAADTVRTVAAAG